MDGCILFEFLGCFSREGCTVVMPKWCEISKFAPIQVWAGLHQFVLVID